MSEEPFVNFGAQVRELKVAEQRYLEAFFRRVRRDNSVWIYGVWPVIYTFVLGVLVYVFFTENVGPGFWIVAILILGILAPVGWKHTKKNSLTEVEPGKKLRPLRGMLAPRLRGTGMPAGLAIGDDRVSPLSLWPVIWQSEVEALVYETNSGQRLIVELEYLNDEVAQAAVEQYESETGRRPAAGTRFVLADDVEAGTAKLEKNYYQLY